MRCRKNRNEPQSSAVRLKSSVEKCDAEVEIYREGSPQEIWNLQQGGNSVDFAKSCDHCQNQQPKENQPEQGEYRRLQIEEDDAPEEIERKL